MAGSDQQTKQTDSKESTSSVTVECGEQSQFEPEEDCGGERQVVKVRVTMDSGAAGHVMRETMFPHVKLERKTSPKKFVAANGEQIKDLGAKRIPFKTNEGVQRCITFRSASGVKPFIALETLLRWMKESAHSKHPRRNGDQAGREQWCVHGGHVGLNP